jgi:hypothetical protein
MSDRIKNIFNILNKAMKRMTTNKQTLSEIKLNERKECNVLGKKVDLNVQHIHNNEDKTNPDLTLRTTYDLNLIYI